MGEGGSAINQLSSITRFIAETDEVVSNGIHIFNDDLISRAAYTFKYNPLHWRHDSFSHRRSYNIIYCHTFYLSPLSTKGNAAEALV